MIDRKNIDFDRMQFLEKVVSAFINKNTYSHLKSTYVGMVTLIGNNENPIQREEKRKIVEKCFELFNTPEFKKKIEEIKAEKNPQFSVLTRATTKVIAETVLSDKKRLYDMSDRYSEKQITQNSTEFIPLVNGLKSPPMTDMFGNSVTIQKVGTLRYSTQSVENESIDKYLITKTLQDSTTQEIEIFSFIDINMLAQNSEYRDTVLYELLSKNNVELSNTNGYLGEIVSTKHSKVQLKVGEQRENAEKFYRYQASKNYALIYDPQDLSAVMYHTRQQALNSQKNNSKDDTDRS